MKALLRKVVPWRLQQAVSWCWGNRYFLAVVLRRVRKRPRYRIMVSTAFFGGVGGTEKHLKALVEGLPEAEFLLKARQLKTSGFIPHTANYTLNCCAGKNKHFDLYIYFAGGGRPDLELDKYSFGTTLIDTNGAAIRDVEHLFDYIAIQTGNYGRYFDGKDRNILAFPPVEPFFPERRKRVQAPEKYFLTVFNPFSQELKGDDLIVRVAKTASCPIVWCFSDKSGWDFDQVPDHPNVIKMKNLSQEELYYLYDNASAYISFSHVESFGWSLAEAFYSGLPIITREVGFITYVKEQAGINVYETDEQLQTLLERDDYGKVEYDDQLFVQNAFPEVIRRILQ